MSAAAPPNPKQQPQPTTTGINVLQMKLKPAVRRAKKRKVSDEALLKRINRRLFALTIKQEHGGGSVIVIKRSANSWLGIDEWYLLLNFEQEIFRRLDSYDLEEMGRELGVLAKDEALEQERAA